MDADARRRADELIAWWRDYRQLVSVPEWYDPLRDKIADAVAQVVKERDAAVGVQQMPFGGLMVGVAWVPASVVGGVGKFYIYEGYGDTFAYTLTPSSLNFATCTWTWGKESFSNGHTGAGPVYRAAWNPTTGPANAQIYAIMGRWVYVPALQCIALHDGPSTSAQCLDGTTRNGIVQLWRPPGTPI